MSTNLVVLSGSVSSQPITRSASYDPDQKTATFSIITSRSWLDNKGETKSSKTYHRLLVKNSRVVGLCEEGLIKQGTHVVVHGTLGPQDAKYLPSVVVKELTLGPKQKLQDIHATPEIVEDSINTIYLGGHLGDKPETIPGDNEMMKFSLATQRRRKEGDVWMDEAVWHRVYALGEKLCKQVRLLEKGSYCLVVGEMTTRKTNTDQRVMEIKANKIVFAPQQVSSGTQPSIHQSGTQDGPEFGDPENDVPFDDILP